MEDYCSPLCSTYLYQDEAIEEMRHCVLYISELEATIVATKEEIRRRELEIVNLKDIVNKTMIQRNEAQQESNQLFLENIILQKHIQIQDKEQETPPPPTVAAGEDEYEALLETVVKIGALPEKGKLLEAVKEAGPLLQTLLLAGPLPKWRHPPPPLITNKRPFDSFSPPPASKYLKL